jgi:endoglucanase
MALLKSKKNKYTGITSYFFMVCFTLYSTAIAAQGFLKTNGQQIVNAAGENVLLRGIGLGGWMLQEGYMLKINRDGRQFKIRERIDSLIGSQKTKQFYDAWLSNHTTKADIDSLKHWGFNSVRLPLHYNLFTLPVEQEKTADNNTWLSKGFALTDSLLSWCRSNNMYLILDLHAAPGGQGNDLNISDRDDSKPSLWDSEANQQKTIDLWKKLATHYVNEPFIGGYDIINEPNWGFEDKQNDKNGTKEQHNVPLRKLMMAITKAIREIDTNHIIIIEGNGWGNNYNGIFPPWDNNMVLSFHKYWNYNNTASIQKMIDARNTYNIPVWIGETGENSNVWYAEAIHLMETNNIGWAWWPLKKIGNNNPFEIKTNEGYQKMISYFNGRSSKPGAEETYNGLMQMTAALKTNALVFHKDVIDAMFRQPFSNAAIPYQANKVINTTVINAVDYDLGKNGFAYFDIDTADYHVSTGNRTAGNRGGMYRNDGVDISKDSATAQYYVTHMEKGEWLQYTVNVKQAGNYSLQLLVSGEQPAKISFTIDAVAGLPTDLPLTGGTKNWRVIPTAAVHFSTGKHIIQIHADEAGFNIKTIQFMTGQ